MKQFIHKEHKIDTLFTVLLFALYLIFILAFLLFSASAYQASNTQARYGYGLSTALSYIAEKVHHYDQTDSIFPGELDGHPALCLKDDFSEQTYITYIYEEDGHLMELFTRENSNAASSMGSIISSISSFQIQWSESDLITIFIIDTDGNEGTLILHPKCLSGGPYESL